jgi:hypothetical protein
VSAVVGAVVASVFVLAAAADGAAAGPVKQGWWNRANDSAFPAAPPAPPDVPEDGLYVASTLGDSQAIAAVTYRTAQPTALTLTMAETPSGDPAVQACPLKAASLDYEPAENGKWQDAPKPDCKTTSVEGKVDEEAGTIAFDVSGLARNGVLAVALVGDGTTRVAFEKPGPQSLTAAAAAPQAPAPSPAPVVQPEPEVGLSTATASPSAGDGFSFSAPSSSPTGTDAPTDAGAAPKPAPDDSTKTASPDTDDSFAVAEPKPVSTSSSFPTRVAQGLAIGVGFALLLYYAQGHGILGARYDR